LATLVLLFACQQKNISPFDQYFTDATLRVDYFHTGDATSEKVEVDQVYQYPSWAGSLVHLIDSLNYGSYYFKVYDQASNTLIYSKGFDSYFAEYQSSTPAIEGQVKQFHESAIIPYPKAPIIFTLEKWDNTGERHVVFEQIIDPNSAVQPPMDPEVKIFTSLDNGDPHIKADIAIIGEGYTAEEEQKFQDDLKRFTEVFFHAEPCKSSKNQFNIQGILKHSQDSGIDEPRAGIDKNTAVNATFNSMGSERYVLTEDNKSLRDIAGNAPYDALYIMVNHSRYGGGGIYNFYCVYTSDNIFSNYLMVHEFGHSFFGLADEYYTSSTAYNDFHPVGYEPAEPNITALLDPANVKWKHLVSEGMEIPTPWAKKDFDSLELIYQTKRNQLKERELELQKNGAPEEEIQQAKDDYDSHAIERNEITLEYLENSPYAGKTGAFEGAGYASTGLYRPSVNCIMFTKTDYFCPVCQDAMTKVINTYAR
jgi:hypothetical protein